MGNLGSSLLWNELSGVVALNKEGFMDSLLSRRVNGSSVNGSNKSRLVNNCDEKVYRPLHRSLGNQEMVENEAFSLEDC